MYAKSLTSGFDSKGSHLGEEAIFVSVIYYSLHKYLDMKNCSENKLFDVPIYIIYPGIQCEKYTQKNIFQQNEITSKCRFIFLRFIQYKCTRLARLTSAASRKKCLRLLGCQPACTTVIRAWAWGRGCTTVYY